MASLASAAAHATASSPPSLRVNLPTSTPAVGALRECLARLMRVGIADGRVFVGVFACIDKGKNIVLVNTEEFRIGSQPGSLGARGRYVGMVMVPWKYVVTVEAENDDENLYS